MAARPYLIRLTSQQERGASVGDKFNAILRGSYSRYWQDEVIYAA
jgi:hypothetical protein